MYSSNASHSCEDQNDFLEKLKGWGNLSSHPPVTTCRSVMLTSPVPVTPPLSPHSLCTSQRDHHGEDLTANSAPASTEIWLSFTFLKRWNMWRIREITSPNQQTSDYSSATAQAATEATARPWCLELPKVMGQNILSALFLYFLFGWLVPADIAALKGNSLRDKQKFSWLATLSTLTSKLNTQKCLIVPLLISNGRILIFGRKKHWRLDSSQMQICLQEVRANLY